MEGEHSYYAFTRTDAKWKDDKPIFILIASNHPIISKTNPQIGKKYDFLGKKIVGTIKEESEVYIFYEPNEFILELEESKLEKPTGEKTCPVCEKACKECKCEKEGGGCEHCFFWDRPDLNLPCSCKGQRKPDEPESEEEPDYHATLKPESEINLLEESKSRGSSDCAYCQRGAETKQLAKCWHCGNDQIKTVHCQKVISDCSCPPPQTNCGRCEKCKPKHTNPNYSSQLWWKTRPLVAENTIRVNNLGVFNQTAERNNDRVFRTTRGMNTNEWISKHFVNKKKPRGRRSR